MSGNDEQPERDRPFYNLKAVVNETGIKPPTLRAWERRYGFPNPTRTQGGHRQYSQSDIDVLRWLIARQDEGVSISHAIDLWRSLSEAGEDPTADDQLRSASDSPPLSSLAPRGGQQIDELREEWVQACLAFDRNAAETVLTRAFALFPPEVVCVQLLQNGLAKIGQQWHQGEATVHQEHFATALSVRRLETLISSAAPPWRPQTLIVATAEGDFHTFGALLFTFLLRRQGWRVIYLGASVPARQLEAMLDKSRPHLAIFTAQLLHAAATLREVAVLLQTRGIGLAFGGGVFSRIDRLQEFIPGHFLGHSVEEAVQAIPSLIAQPAEMVLPDSQIASLSDAYESYAEQRALIESDVRAAFVTAGKPTEQLASVNRDFAEAIDAALKLGDLTLLATDIHGIQELLVSHHWPGSLLKEYIAAYYEAARIHLPESATVIVTWLASLAPA